MRARDRFPDDATPEPPAPAARASWIRRTLRGIARSTLLAGLAGGAAMVPVGLVLRAFGQPVNVYGELTANLLFGSTAPPALLAVHLAVSLGLAAPLAVLAVDRRVASAPIGLAWAIAAWVLLNLGLLPLAFGRPSAWNQGLPGLWPGFLVHAVYGLVVGGALRRIGTAPPAAPDGASARPRPGEP